MSAHWNVNYTTVLARVARAHRRRKMIELNTVATYVDCPPSSLSRYETGRVVFPAARLVLYAQAIDTTAAHLLADADKVAHYLTETFGVHVHYDNWGVRVEGSPLSTSFVDETLREVLSPADASPSSAEKTEGEDPVEKALDLVLGRLRALLREDRSS